MAKTDIPAPERLGDAYPGIGIWRVHVDSLREREINAQVMSDDKFRRLAENIKGETSLESLPLVWKDPSNERDEFVLISGHHRTRAARAAGVMVIVVLAIERELTEDEITAKQLAHNALNGYSDPTILKQLYDSIDDINQKIASGLTDQEVALEMPDVKLDDIDVEFDFEPIYIMFMKSGADRFEQMIDGLPDQQAKKYLADKADFDKFADGVRKISKFEDIRNIAGIMSYWCDIIEAHYEGRSLEDELAARETAKAEAKKNG